MLIAILNQKRNSYSINSIYIFQQQNENCHVTWSTTTNHHEMMKHLEVYNTWTLDTGEGLSKVNRSRVQNRSWHRWISPKHKTVIWDSTITWYNLRYLRSKDTFTDMRGVGTHEHQVYKSISFLFTEQIKCFSKTDILINLCLDPWIIVLQGRYRLVNGQRSTSFKSNCSLEDAS